MSPLEIKIALTQAGTVLAAAVVGNLPDDLKADPEIANDPTKAQNWMGYRLTQVYAAGLANALDPANANHWLWPDWVEKGDAGAAGLGQIGGLLGEVLKGGALTPALIQKLLDLGLSKLLPSSAPSPSALPSALSPGTVAPGVAK